VRITLATSTDAISRLGFFSTSPDNVPFFPMAIAGPAGVQATAGPTGKGVFPPRGPGGVWGGERLGTGADAGRKGGRNVV